MRRVLLATFVLLPLAALPAGRAGEKPAEKMKVTLVAILGSEEGSTIDRRLKEVADEIQKREPQLKSFKIYSMTSRELPVRDKTVFDLMDGKTAQVAIKHGIDETDRVAVGVTAPDQKEIVYRTVYGKFMPFVTGYRTKDRERLIIAVRVESMLAK